MTLFSCRRISSHESSRLDSSTIQSAHSPALSVVAGDIMEKTTVNQVLIASGRAAVDDLAAIRAQRKSAARLLQ